MDHRDVGDASRALAGRIAARVRDPSLWMLEVRRASDALGLDPTRSILVSSAESLQTVCYFLADEARKQGRTRAEIDAL